MGPGYRVMSRFYQALEKAEQSHPQGGRPRSWALHPHPMPAANTPPSEPNHTPYQVAPLGLEPAQAPTINLDPHLVALLTPGAVQSELYRKLGHMIEQRPIGETLNIIAISSPMGNDGKTIATLNLAGALVQNPELKVLVIDADLRRPSLATYLGLSHANAPGLVEAILDPTCSLEQVIQHLPSLNLSVLLAGRSLTSPHEVLNTPRFGALMAEARQLYDYILIDTPPLLPFTDCELMAQWIDGFFLIATAHKTPRKLIDEALEVLSDKLIGLIFNQDKRPLSAYDSYTRASNRRESTSFLSRLRQS